MASGNVEKIKVGDSLHDVGLRNIYINEKGNLNVETSESLGNTSKGKINIESMSDIQLKPGDDIILYSHHREVGKQDEVALKVTDGNDVPVKLQVNTSGLTLTTKDKVAVGGDDPEELKINVNTGIKEGEGNTKAYLKIQARSIDLGCEEHGGIALQPCAYDHPSGSTHFENKIKFESGRVAELGYNPNGTIRSTLDYKKDGKIVKGGKGMEFGTFNNAHTSIYTSDYRFRAEGIVYAVTRGPIETTSTGKVDYPTQGDDFKDILMTSEGNQCTHSSSGWKAPEGEEVLGASWESIIKAAKYIERSKGSLDIILGRPTGEGGETSSEGLSADDLAAIKFVKDNSLALQEILEGGAQGGGLPEETMEALQRVLGVFQVSEDSTELEVPRDAILLTSGDPETASFRDIIKTANAFNSGPDRHAKITSKGNLEISTEPSYHWIPGVPSEEAIELEVFDPEGIYNLGDLSDLGITLGGTYKAEDSYYSLGELTNPKIQVESENSIELTSGGSSVGVSSEGITLESKGGTTDLKGDIIKVSSTQEISLNESPSVLVLSKKLTAKGAFKEIDTTLKVGILNNTAKESYYSQESGVMKYPVDSLYKKTPEGTLEVLTYGTASTDTALFFEDGSPVAVDTTYLTYLWNESEATPKLYSITTKGKSPVINKSGAVETPQAEGSEVQFVEETYTPSEDEVSIEPGGILETGSCSFSDIVKLITWMKSNGQGPWGV